MTEPGKSSEAHSESSPSPFEAELDGSPSLPPYSVNQITTFRASFEEDIAARQATGIAGIGLWRQKLTEIDEVQAVEAIRQSGLDVTTLSFAGGFTGSSGLQYREAVEDGYAAVFSAAAFGAGTLIVSPGSRGRYTARHERRLVTQAICELAIVAEEIGVDLALLSRDHRYAGNWTSLHCLRDAVELADATGRSNVGVVCDTFQLSPLDMHDLEAAASRIRVLQLNDAPAEPTSEYDQLIPGAGTLALCEAVQCLFENGFSGDIDVQVWSEELWQQSEDDILSKCQQFTGAILRGALAGTVSPVSA